MPEMSIETGSGGKGTPVPVEVVNQRVWEHSSSPWGGEWKRIGLYRRCEVWGGHLKKGRQIVWFILFIFQWQYFVFFLTSKFSVRFGKKSQSMASYFILNSHGRKMPVYQVCAITLKFP